MRQANLVNTRLTLLALLLVSFSAPPLVRAQKSAPKSAPRPSAIVFAVAGAGGEVTIDPILGLGARGRVLPAGGEADDSLQRFAAAYFKAGRKYRLISGGGDAGSVTVRASRVGEECFRTGARVEAETSARLGGNVMALATDSQTLGKRTPSRRAPTEEERAGVEKLVRTLFAQKRLSAAQLRNLQTINLTAIDLDNNGAMELAGTFKVARGSGAADLLFVLAQSQPAGGFRAALSNFDQLKAADLPNPEALESAGPGGFLSEILIDHLDLDGDGTGELFTYGQSFEGAQYAVYKKTRGRWLKLQEFYVYRCAY